MSRIFYQPEVLKVISNVVHWAVPSDGPKVTFGNVQPLEKISASAASGKPIVKG